MWPIYFILFILLILIIVFIICNCSINIYYKNGGDSSILNLNTHHSKKQSNLIIRKQVTPMTYTISGEKNGLVFSALRDILKENNFIEKPITERVHVSFGTFYKSDQTSKNANYDPAFYKQYAAIKNVLGDHNPICDKTILFKTIKNLIPIGYKYIPNTYTIEEIENYFITNKTNNNIFMIKKKDASRQMGVLVITSKEEFIEAKKKLQINQSNGVVSEYITNPLTVDGKKMHLRVYILMTIQSGITRCYIFDEYRIYVAESDYKKGDWLNSKIHISGADSTKKTYIWPNDVDGDYVGPEMINELNECLRVLCLGMALSNIKNYEESDAGYHLYGADILLTNHNKAYILEVNKRPGFGWVQKEPNPYNYSYKIFSFILKHSVFPYLGLIRQPEALADVIVNGALTSFGKQLIGANRSILIPIADAKHYEIDKAKTFFFHNEKTTFNYLTEQTADEILTFLIANNETIIGYLVVLNRWINIAISKNFQARGIATAMIAQFMEIYGAQSFTLKENNPIVYIQYYAKSQILHFMRKIANRLNFETKSIYFERRVKIKNNIIIKINSHELLTYNKHTIHTDNGFDKQFLIQEIERSMTHTEMQFVHLAYNTAHKYEFIKSKLSTGSRYSNEFITQGAELKSVIFFPKIKFINSEQLLNQYIETSPMAQKITYMQLFNKSINDSEIQDNTEYKIYDRLNELYYFANTKSAILKIIKEIKLKKERELNELKELKHIHYINDLNFENLYNITEYYSPYLLNGKMMILKLFIVLYISGNGIKKCYVFDQYIICTSEKEYSIKNESDWNDPNIMWARMITTDKIYEWPNYFLDGELKTFIKNKELEKYIEIISKMLVNCEYAPYPEANSGFVEFTMNLKFVKNNGVYYPIISALNNTIQIWKFKNISNTEYKKFNDQFSKDYYHWLISHIIYPHFGLSKQIRPNALALNCENTRGANYAKNKIIDESIISLLSLQTDGTKFFNIKIYMNEYNSEYINIGHINLNLADISNNIIILKHIELFSKYRKKTIAENVIFLLMDILAAHYAPNHLSLKFADIKQMHTIAYKLEFHKIQENGKEFFIKSCR